MVRFWFIRLRLWWQMLNMRHPWVKMAARAAVGLVAALALAFWGWIMWPQTSLFSSRATAEARGLIEKGRYDQALREIDDHLAQNPSDRAWAGLKDQMLKEVKVELRLHYLRGNKLPVQDAERGKLTLSPSDTYYYVVNPSESCHLYLFQISSAGELLQVFPNKANSSARNPVAPGKQQIPSGPQGLRLNATAGEVRVLVVAARWALPELEDLAKAAANERDAARRRLALDRFLARVDNEKQHADRLGGLSFGEARFANSGK